jgi:hypothetical protein
MQNACKKPDALKLFIRSIFRIAYHKENTGWFNTRESAATLIERQRILLAMKLPCVAVLFGFARSFTTAR